MKTLIVLAALVVIASAAWAQGDADLVAPTTSDPFSWSHKETEVAARWREKQREAEAERKLEAEAEAAAQQARKTKCGKDYDRIDAMDIVGLTFGRIKECTGADFTLLGQLYRKDGAVVSTWQPGTSDIRIYVIDGIVVAWDRW